MQPACESMPQLCCEIQLGLVSEAHSSQLRHHEMCLVAKCNLHAKACHSCAVKFFSTHTAHNKERSTVTDNYLVKELDACMEEKRRRKYHIDYRPANENSQFAAPAWQRMRATLVSSVWNFCTDLRSVNSCGSVLYTSTIPNMERLYNVSWNCTSNICPYNCLSCFGRGYPKTSMKKGSNWWKTGWALPSTLLWIKPNTPMFLRSVGGAKLYSRKASELVTSISWRKWFCTESNLANR